MKKIKNIFFVAFCLGSLISCETETDVDTPAEIADENGAMINVSSGSSGAFLGAPQGADFANSEVEISEAYLTLQIRMISGSVSDIEKFEIVKSINGGEEIVVSETTTLPYTIELESIEDFLSGTDYTEDELRIGDQISFKVKTIQNDGDVYYYDRSMGVFTLTLNCAYDLAGTYIMTNTICNNPQTVTISQNSDGTWYASTADGGLLQFCTSNTSLTNDGSFSVVCGGVVEASNDVAFCGSNGIGCITGGLWDEGTGVLTLEHSNTFFTSL